MDVSSSSAATLTRPRVVIQVLAGVTGVFIAWQFWQQFRLQSLTSNPASSSASGPASVGGNGLHRSNAVRRTDRSTRRQIQAALDDVEHRLGSEERRQIEDILTHHFGRQLADHGGAVPAADDSESPDHDTHHDENAENTNSRPPATSGDIGGETETVAGEERTMEDDWAHDDSWNIPPPRAGHNIVGLLFRVSEDNARRNAYVHRGCMCNACGLLPIRGIRYRCANCADFDLCETCESQGLHIKTHVFYKVKVPAPPFGPKSMQPVWYPGDPDTALRNLPGALIRHLAKETGFERPELEALWEQWTFIANTEWRDDPDELFLAADRKTFERYLVPSSGHRRTAPNLIHDRMFAFYDTNGDDLISFPEFLMGLSYKKGKQRLERIFKGYDVDGDGFISRRDCLRIFRTYYVLYKHMHGDVLEGLDQQVMNNTETQQLVTGRQPLSSHFGREGRVPEADHGRPMEGKIFHSNGDVWVGDKNGVVSETRPDVGDRGEILSSLFNHAGPSDDVYGSRFFTHASEHVTSPTGDEDVSRIYHEALLNPPTRVEELVSLLHGEPRNIHPSELGPVDQEEQQDGEENGEENVPSEEETSAEEEESATEDASRPIEYFTSFADASRGSSSAPQVVREVGNERWTNRPPTDSQLRAQHLRLEAHKKRTMDRKLRVTVRKKLFDRWKKRNFYLAEEEGTSPPEGWNEEDDVLADINGNEVAGSSKEAQPPLSARSRSSSKVRFAEDTDDYEIRSNPSTSSRSVPERWGGMDIPDAERDMGKEILYVVTQQAFNELLDVLFKEKEDLAVKAAETREYRDAYRELLNSFIKDKAKGSSQHQDENGNGNEENKEKDKGKEKEHESETEKITVIQVDEKKPIHNRTLDELLATSGYTVDETLALEAEEDEEDTSSEDEDSVDATLTAEEPEPITIHTSYRDPTMPQFRPNSDSDVPPPSPATAPTYTPKPALKRRPDKLKGINGSANGKPARPGQKVGKPLTRPPEAALVEWRKHDAAEKEAKARGGWGRLDLAEFKDIWHREESGPHRLDYMGTWIDFCIP
ncbi:EF hand domain-containing protein [Diaporthe amygdali]|uniref:EF hand domain-containing protein n=1 Tax=Phomopsis amygdali TaxID=1214568 RepID=UPI0022FE62B1|nr:EF hand domain-containing protein [Diaporthe amygdali]KAJ0122461.1 EF hand domain-containing protein [Diaporthe amygdali]